MTDQQPERASIENVYLDVTVELARKEITLGEARRVQKSDFIAFDKLAGEAFDILVNQRVFAEGEIVVITDMMAIRITRLIDRKSRVIA
jgi:flagellar motor switch protein FliN/FliY